MRSTPPAKTLSQILSRAESASTKFTHGDGTGHINEAIVLGRQALDRCLPGHPERWRSLAQLASHFSSRYERLGNITDLHEAVILNREALQLIPSGHPGRSASLNNVANYLSSRYMRLGDMTDLNEVIILGRQALDLRPSGHLDRSTSLSNVANYLSFRYQRLGDMTDLGEAIILGRQALDLCPSGHPDRSISLNNVSGYLSSRYKRLGDMTDLHEAIILSRQALDLRPSGHPYRSSSLNNVANHLSSRYEQLGDMTDLNEAIILAGQALDLLPSGHPHQSMLLNNIAKYLSSRYKRLGDMTDLHEAIILGKQALDLRPSGHPYRSMSLNNVAFHLSYRYERLGDMTDLNEAILLTRHALDLLPLKHPDRSMSLSNVANCLSSRYKQLGDMTDLHEAIILGRQALDLLPSGHPHQLMSLNNVANHLSSRYERLGDMADLSEAIIMGRQALDLLPSAHPHRSVSLSNVANYLSSRYERLGDMSDLTEANILGRQALDLRPSGHPDRSMSLNNVASYIFSRYKRLRDMADLNEVIILGRQALNLRPSGHPDRSTSLDWLARCLCVRFTLSGKLKDRDDLFDLYSELSNIPQTLSPHDLLGAKEWIIVAESFHHPTVLLAYETSLRLLVQHLATLPSLPNHLPIFKDLASSLAVDAFSACVRKRDLQKAVELLEQGRGVFWSQIDRLRSPLQEVIASGPEGQALAEEFTRLSSEMHNTIHSQGSDQHSRLCSLNLDLQSTITKIRALPGLARFLLPPSFPELQHAASSGPVVVVNASKYSCDALVIFFDRDPIHIPLEIKKSHVQDLSSELKSLTVLAKTMDMARHFARLLRVLWDEIVSPIANFLQTIVPRGSRVWWCPTSEFCLLPLHAAGPYRRGQRKFSQLYISSYTPTLTALIRARRIAPSPTISSLHEKRLLAVGQASIKGESKLHTVDSELAIVAQRIRDLMTFTRLDGTESNLSQVSEELTRSEWVHFACHGIPNRKHPFDSAFGLYDGRFTVERIIGCELENPEFAYLSACHTTAGDEENPDEVIHLASAMQFAGFRSVIGTMWAVDDAETNKITAKFYENMLDENGRLDHTRAALALHRTMNSLVGIVPLDQRILYVHIGA